LSEKKKRFLGIVCQQLVGVVLSTFKLQGNPCLRELRKKLKKLSEDCSEVILFFLFLVGNRSMKAVAVLQY